jgi:hypothetical protein
MHTSMQCESLHGGVAVHTLLPARQGAQMQCESLIAGRGGCTPTRQSQCAVNHMSLSSQPPTIITHMSSMGTRLVCSDLPFWFA